LSSPAALAIIERLGGRREHFCITISTGRDLARTNCVAEWRRAHFWQIYFRARSDRVDHRPFLANDVGIGKRARQGRQRELRAISARFCAPTPAASPRWLRSPARKIAGVETLMHNDVMSSPKPPEPPIEERIGEMIGKIIVLALCAFFLWGYTTFFGVIRQRSSLNYTYSNFFVPPHRSPHF